MSFLRLPYLLWKAATDAWLVRKVRLEAIVERLFDKSIAIGQKQYLLCPRAVQQNINKAHRGPGLSGTGCHDKQRAPLSCFKSLGHAPDRFVLVGAFADLFVDRRIFERGLVLAYEMQPEQVVE